MKKFSAIILILALMLTGCNNFFIPETIEIDNKLYKTGFYGSLWPNKYEFEGETQRIDDINLTKIVHNKFDLYHANIGFNSGATIYCAKEDYDKALTFYSNPENYNYCCDFTEGMSIDKIRTVQLPDVDINKFEDLLNFAEKSSYEPFDKKHNEEVETVKLPMPDDTNDTCLTFYKESVDSLFISPTPSFYIINNTLYLLYQYDLGHGEYERLVAVKAPDNLSNYFVSYMAEYMDESVL